MIRIANVTKTYRDSQVALDNVSFNMHEGEMAFLTGPSGAGKTTLLKLLTMTETPTSGQIFIDHINLSRIKTHQIPLIRRQIGIIFQNTFLIPHRSVYHNVALPLLISGYSYSEMKQRVKAALEKVGLHHKEKSLANTLSSGEQQRVGIARAIVNKPKILLADEPTGNLDLELSHEIIKLFQLFHNSGVLVLIATHNLSLIASFNHRIITLKNGSLLGKEYDTIPL